MARHLASYLKRFSLARADLEFSHPAAFTVDSEFGIVGMAKDATGKFPLPSIYEEFVMRTNVYSPAAIRSWLVFYPSADIPIPDPEVDQMPALDFRLSDGVGDYWWDGTAWVPNDVNWNTGEEVAEHFSEFSADAHAIQIAVRFTPDTNGHYAPVLYGLKVLGGFAHDPHDDLIYRTLVPALNEGVKPFGRLIWECESDMDTLPIGTFELPYVIEAVDCVYVVDDPTEADLFVSYDGTNIALSEAVASGTSLMVRFRYNPQVAVMTDVDFIEVGQTPMVYLENERVIKESRFGSRDEIYDLVNEKFHVMPPAVVRDIQYRIVVVTDGGADQRWAIDELERFVAKTPQLRSVALDEPYDLVGITSPVIMNSPNAANLHRSAVEFVLKNVPFWFGETTEKHAVTSPFEPDVPKPPAIPSGGGSWTEAPAAPGKSGSETGETIPVAAPGDLNSPGGSAPGVIVSESN